LTPEQAEKINQNVTYIKIKFIVLPDDCMVIKTKSIYQHSEENDDRIRVLVTRFYPRGIKKDKFDYWIRELSPSGGLLKNYRQGKYNWEEFKVAFLSEMRDSKDSLEIIQALNAQNESTVINCCATKESESIVIDISSKLPSKS